jgi:uncharacterized spore protein YtfJ
MKLDQFVTTATDAITVRRVFAEPYEKDGTTVIAAARVQGGGGGGGGHDGDSQEGEGGGFGMAARPAGAYVIRNGTVTWQPAVDPTRILVTAAAVLIVWLCTRNGNRRGGPRRRARRH